MKKFFISFALFAALVFVVSCGGGGSKTGDNTDTGDTVTDSDTADTDSPSDTEPSNSDTEPSDNPDTEPSYEPTSDPTSDPTTEPTTEPTSDPTTDPTGEQEEGIYLGIIGFNYKLNIRNLSYLTNSNMTDFQDFIDDFEMDDGTALYFADYTALKMMRDYTPVPPQLQTVALVTFTDGEDTSSDGPTNDPENYNDPDVYLNAIHNKIVTNGIHGLSVEAYSIGLRSGDTGSDFKSRLEKLASSSDNAFEVADMDEVQDRFTKIAEDLYSVFKTINIDFKVLGNYSDGTRMRFTLDIYCDHDENVCEKNGSYSNLYIDATYRRSGNERSFENFAYHGFSGNLTTVKCGERDEKGFYPCTFGNLQYDNMDTEVKQIELWKNDSSEWKHENEALKQGDSKVNESKSSALIMLVLDCTTSLGNSKFEKLKEAGKDFIETLVNGGSGVTTTPCDNDPCSGIANSTGICTPSGTNYVCGCNSGYDWNGTQCVKPATPCDPNPCTSISNSNGNCTVSGASYVCGCNSGYNWNGTQCLDVAAEECASVSGSWNSSTGKCTRTQNCSSKPANTVWNTVSSITQTYNYDDEIWEPSTTSSFNETGSTSQCRYKCASGYDWNGSTCVDPAAEECASIGGTWNSSSSKCTRTQNCSSKPANTVWNTVSSITQTWNGSTWEPSTTSSYNTSGSTSQCRYKCATNYEWNGSSCVASIPECSSTSSTPCKDSSTGYIWSAKASTTYTWQNAVDYCNSYSEGGLSGWHLPTITELRTLILNCPSTMPTGSCAVKDPGCLSSSCWTSATCASCSQDSSGGHSKFGETGWFWSSSTSSGSTGYAWLVLFSGGYVYDNNKTNDLDVRCVR